MRKTLQLILVIFAYSAIAQTNLTANLKLCMPCNGDATDVSGNNNHGFVSGAVLTTDMSGNANQAYLFNGPGEYIDVGNLSVYAPTNELTIVVWGKSNITTSNCLFIINPDDMYDRCVGCAQYLSGYGTMMVWDYGDITAGGRVLHQNMPVDNTNWHQYVYIISESCNLKQIYYDGVLLHNSSYAMNGILNKNKPLYIGGGVSSGGGGSIRWYGKIDNVIIYNRPLNQGEVTQLYSNPDFCSTLDKRQSQSESVLPCTLTGISERENGTGVLFNPTISDGLFGSNDSAERVEIIDIEGRVVMGLTSVTTGQTLDLRHLSNGIYTAKFIVNGSPGIQKVVIVR
jgi:hypothetical protein